jgi:CheY-specific phosphatase CheX
MPDSIQAEALSAAVRDVLETMSFAEVAGETAGDTGSEVARIEARLLFHGQRPGKFRVAISPTVARGIAVDFLGLEDGDAIEESQVGEVVCEVANMICGSVLSRLEADLVFELTSPRLVEAAEQGGWPQEAARTFDLGRGGLTAAIRFEEV